MNKHVVLPAAVVVVLLGGGLYLYLRTRTNAGVPEQPVTSNNSIHGEPARAAVTPAEVAVPSSSEKKSLSALVAILAAKNDNDPRLDRDFNQLSQNEKLGFQNYYRHLPAEKRNERGTIVYLLGRNLTAAADFDFFHEVLTEPACLSLADCSRDEKPEDDDHYRGDREVSLAYPQLVSIKAVERFLAENANAELTPAALAVVRTARNSRVPIVARIAAKVRDHF